MSIVLTVLIAFYLGGVLALLVNELDTAGDGIQANDVVGAVGWPIKAATLIYTKIAEYRKGT